MVMDKRLHPTVHLQQMKNTVEQGPEEQERAHADTSI